MISEARNRTKQAYIPPTGRLSHNPTGELIKILAKQACFKKSN